MLGILYIAAWILIPVAAIVGIIYFLVKRPSEVESETFEKRDN